MVLNTSPAKAGDQESNLSWNTLLQGSTFLAFSHPRPRSWYSECGKIIPDFKEVSKVRKILVLTLTVSLLLPVLALADQVPVRKEITDSDGTTREFIFYINNKETGRQTFDNSGNAKTTGAIPDALYRSYYGSGKIQGTWNYQGGHLQGASRIIYENGALKWVGTFENGKKQGMEIEFDQEGYRTFARQVTNGKPNGSEREYYKISLGGTPDGMNDPENSFPVYGLAMQIKTERFYREGILDGPEKEYYPPNIPKNTGAGATAGKSPYTQPKPPLVVLPTGTLKATRHYKNALKDGLEQEFYENEQLMAVRTWKQGRMEGPELEFYNTAVPAKAEANTNAPPNIPSTPAEANVVLAAVAAKIGPGNVFLIPVFENGPLKRFRQYRDGKVDLLIEFSQDGKITTIEGSRVK